jgi:hypothetical protein
MLLCLGICSQNVSAEMRSLVLVAANQKFSPIASIEVRKLFMGIPVIVDNQPVIPLINITGKMIHEVFLQKIVFMSARKYKRQLISRVFRYGGSQPEFYSDVDELIKDLRDWPYNVSYMWARDAEKSPELFIVQELWKGDIE